MDTANNINHTTHTHTILGTERKHCRANSCSIYFWPVNMGYRLHIICYLYGNGPAGRLSGYYTHDCEPIGQTCWCALFEWCCTSMHSRVGVNYQQVYVCVVYAFECEHRCGVLTLPYVTAVLTIQRISNKNVHTITFLTYAHL